MVEPTTEDEIPEDTGLLDGLTDGREAEMLGFIVSSTDGLVGCNVEKNDGTEVSATTGAAVGMEG